MWIVQCGHYSKVCNCCTSCVITAGQATLTTLAPNPQRSLAKPAVELSSGRKQFTVTLWLVLHLSIRFQSFDTIRFDRIIRSYLTIVKYDRIIRSKHCRQIESAVSSLQTFITFCTHVHFQQKSCHCKAIKKVILFTVQFKHTFYYIKHCYQLKFVVMN